METYLQHIKHQNYNTNQDLIIRSTFQYIHHQIQVVGNSIKIAWIFNLNNNKFIIYVGFLVI